MSSKYHFTSAVDEMNALQQRIADPGDLGKMQRQLDQITGGSLRRVLADQKRLADVTGMAKMFAQEERQIDPSGMGRMFAKEEFVARTLEHKRLTALLRSDFDKLAGTSFSNMLRSRRSLVAGTGLNETYNDALACEARLLASATKPFVDLREQLAGTPGHELALKWERLATRTLGSTLHDLFRFERATAVMALDRHAALGSLAWLEEPRDDEDAPKVKVVALHAHRPARPDPFSQLKFEPGSGFNCKRCGEHIPLDFAAWITKSPDTAFLQGTIDVAVQCPNCGDQPLDNDDDDFTLEALHEIVRGEEDDVPESGVYRIKKKGEE